MVKADFHTHTTFCDGASTPREMVEAAFKAGFTDFGISGHADYDCVEKGFGMIGDIFTKYLSELRDLREEYRGRMNVYIGIELDSCGPYQKAEYAVGSTHAIPVEGGYLAVDMSDQELTAGVEKYFGGDWYAMTGAYFAQHAKAAEIFPCDWIGHFDLVCKFNEGNRHFDENSSIYREQGMAALEKLLGSNLPFEINTGAISRGYRKEPYPSMFFLKEIKARGGRIMINSDSHHTSTIGYGFRQAKELAEAAGFGSVCVLSPDGMKEIGLSEFAV